MPEADTLGRLLLKDAVPEDLRHLIGPLDKKNTAKLYQAIAELYPEKYREIAKKIADISTQAGYESGGYSFGIEDMQPHPETAALRKAFEDDVGRVLADKTLSPKMRDATLIKAAIEHGDPIRDSIMKQGLAAKNPLAMQVASGAKGKPENMKALVAGDSLYQDQNFNPVPYPITRSFAEGLTPAQYFAGTFGARFGIVSTKLSTASGGWLAKRLSNSAHRLLVTSHDGHDRHATIRGYAVPINEPENEGAFLAHPTAGYPRDTALTHDVLTDLKRRGIKDILVRSPMVGGPDDGGVYGKDVGIRERGRVAPTGDYVGLAAAQSLCLAIGTRVRMADGSVKEIESINVGDMVLGCSTTGTVRPVRVLKRYANGIKHVHETTFRRGTGRTGDSNMLRVQSTLDHKILSVTVSSRNDRRPQAVVQPICKPLNRNYRFFAKLSSGFDDTGLRDEPYALALGLLIGDGCYTDKMTSNGVMLSCHDPKLVTDTEEYFRSLGCRLVPQTTPGEYRVSLIPVAGPRTDRKYFNSKEVLNPIRLRLLELGMWGKRSYEKVLPDTTSWTNASVAALLSGLIATDGYVYVKPDGAITVGFSSTSLPLVESVRYLLSLRFGVSTSAVAVTTKKKPDSDETYRPQHAIVINGWEKIAILVRTLNIPGVKNARLRESFARWPHGRKSAESGRCTFVSQTYVGERETYDIQVDHPDHLFLLENGLVVSNSEPMTQLIIGCLAKGTLVRMADGSVKAIESIVIGDQVMGSDGEGRIEPTRVTHTFDKWYQTCGRYKTASGAAVACTPDHKFLGVGPSGEPHLAPISEHTALIIAGYDSEEIVCEGEAYLATYDIEVDNESHLFVLASGWICSNSKHTGGVAGSTKGQKGFPVLDQLTTIPSTFPGGAVHAQHDGTITSIREAPQGGRYIAVDGKEHYARPDLELSVKPGDKVEAGDVMTDGIENPSEYVRHKGIGEGRKRFVDVFRKLAAEAGFHPHRRNLELVTRGLIDHVRMEKETEDHVPGDIVSYTQLEHHYDPRPGSRDAPPKELLGMHLERPVLHYTIGDRIKPSMLPVFEKYGVQSVTAHPEPPPFSPVMIRSQDIPGADPDWGARLLGSNTFKTLTRGVHRGDVSDTMGTSFAPALAAGVNFGQRGKTVGWKPEDVSGM